MLSLSRPVWGSERAYLKSRRSKIRDRAQEYDEIIRTLIRIAAHQDTINDDLWASLQAQQAMNQRIESFNARQLEINADIRTTLARLETIIARMGQQGENGREP